MKKVYFILLVLFFASNIVAKTIYGSHVTIKTEKAYSFSNQTNYSSQNSKEKRLSNFQNLELGIKYKEEGRYFEALSHLNDIDFTNLIGEKRIMFHSTRMFVLFKLLNINIPDDPLQQEYARTLENDANFIQLNVDKKDYNETALFFFRGTARYFLGDERFVTDLEKGGEEGLQLLFILYSALQNSESNSLPEKNSSQPSKKENKTQSKPKGLTKDPNFKID